MNKKLYQKCILTCVAFSALTLFSGCGKAENAYEKALEYTKDSKYSESVKYFKEAIKSNDEKAEYYIDYGLALNEMGDYQNALKQFDTAYQRVDNKITRQNNKKIYFGRAVANYGLGNYAEVLKDCDSALEIKEAEEINESILLVKAAAQQFAGDIDGAALTYDTVIKNNKENTDAYIDRAKLSLNQNDYEEAAYYYTEAIKADKTSSEAYFGLYNVYVLQNDTTNSEKVLDDIIEKKAETAEDTMQTGKAWYYKGDYDKAQEYLQKAQKDGCKEAVYYQGLVLMANSDYDGAKEKFDEYIKSNLTMNRANAYNQAAGCLMELENYKEAMKYITNGLKMGATEAERMLLKNQVILYEKENDYANAKTVAETYIKKYPDDKKMKKELRFIKTRYKK